MNTNTRVIEDLALYKIADYIEEKLDTAYYIQNNIEISAPLTVVVLNETVTIRVYLDEFIDGTIEGIRIYDDDADLFIEQMHEFIKPANRGFYKIFRIRVRELIR